MKKYSWKFLSVPRLDEALCLWEKTPYRPGQQAPQIGADCIRLVAGILDSAYGTHTEIPNAPSNTGLHDRRRAMRVIKKMLDSWHGADQVTDDSLEPGDILVTRSSGSNALPSNPGHVMIVTTTPFKVMHTSHNLKAHRVDIYSSREVLRNYRPRRKDLWT